MVITIIVDGICLTTDEENNIFSYPVDVLNKDIPPRYCPVERDFEITVYDFINNYWDLDEYDSEEFTFYF